MWQHFSFKTNERGIILNKNQFLLYKVLCQIILSTMFKYVSKVSEQDTHFLTTAKNPILDDF